MTPRKAVLRAVPCASLALAACSGGGGSGTPGPTPASVLPTPSPIVTPAVTASPIATPTASLTPVPATPTPTPTPTPSPTPVPSAQPQVVYLNFSFARANSTYGTLAFYAPIASATAAEPITGVAGSHLLFINSDTSPHTASGLGSAGFPASFTNANGPAASGSTVDASAWSTGTLSPGATSTPFTLGPPGTYYFGCYYHYSLPMQDVIVSTPS